MSKGSNSSTTNTASSVAPNPQAMAAYSALLSRATNVSETPFAPYTGQEVAPTNSQQLMGVGNTNMAAMGFAPYSGNAGAMINNAGQMVNAGDINTYMDPYTQSVIDATQADFDTQNKRAQSATTSGAASQNALGGNRVGVAQALTQEGQERVQAPVMAQLRSQGFQSAEQMANAQKQRELQAGQTLTGAGLTAAQQQFAFGTQEQQTSQAQDTQNMTDYYTAQGYPFATAQWLAAITLGTGAQMGQSSTGTSTTQGATPNQFLQGAGLGLSALAAFSDRRLKENIKEVGKLHDGQKIYRYNFKGDPTTHVGLISQEVEKEHPEAVGKVAGFGTVDYDAATKDAVKRWSGGAIHGFAEGGTPYGPGTQGWVPTIGNIGGKTLTDPGVHPAKMADQTQPDMSKMGKNLGAFGKSIYDNWPSSGGYDWDANPTGGYENAGWDVTSGFLKGGRIPISTGFAGGGRIFDDDEIDATDLPPIRYTPSTPGEKTADYNAARLSGVGGPDQSNTVASNASLIKPPEDGATVATGFSPDTESFDKATDIGRKFRKDAPFEGISGGRGFARDETTPEGVMAFDGSGAPNRVTIESGRNQPTYVPGSSAPQPKPGMGGFNPFGLSDEARQGLISMGLGMMANRRGGKGSFLAGVGEGGEQGMTTYASARAATAAKEALERKEAFEREKFNRPYSEMTAEEKVRFKETQQQNQFLRMKALAEIQEKERAHNLAKNKPLQWTDEDGVPHMALPRAQKDGSIEYWPVDMKTGQMASSPLGGSLKEGAARALDEKQRQIENNNGGALRNASMTDGIVLANNKLVEAGPYDYRREAPIIEKGMAVPEPASVSGKSVQTLKTDAESYLLTGKAPPISRGNSPVAVQQQKYRDAVMNYGNALAASRGLQPKDTAEMWRTAPGLLRFVLGAPGQSVISLGTAVSHLDTMKEYAKEWAKGDLNSPILNSLRATISRQFGESAGTNLVAVGKIVGPEVIKAIGVAGAGTEKDREGISNLFTTSNSEKQTMDAIKAVEKLLGGQLESKERQAANAGVSPERFKSLVGDRAYDVLKNIDKPQKEEASAKPVPTERDRAYAKAHPEVRQKFISRFGVEP